MRTLLAEAKNQPTGSLKNFILNLILTSNIDSYIQHMGYMYLVNIIDAQRDSLTSSSLTGHDSQD